ncbi:DUF402 domain-containing protein [Paenibacillus larvae]|uniref:DUF402 domain-containing protein n=2 Tax=Paenibacillus larvae TaxID=1464 RepID=V9W642_9BACL|nr:DUF402 domain-containing protein [Paenibacillus larvae]AHD04602.1 hypothetical protein ERIC2_c07620 [Paenibacillus larvae subsp. larvae DSM 25430]AVG11197.1 hypothetical protein ERICII_00763 [Paenibacillus larvae subsp. larvae DSM 25430]MDR5594952.1 DUF402 domain-containing protein [Paenibacillus larvae]
MRHNRQSYVIKSFKHDGHLHRTWLENWRVAEEFLCPLHREEGMIVLVNNQTKIQEADGKEWTSRIPGVSFFIPRQWHNVIALIENTGIRYYCNVASPSYLYYQTLTYIDYDLDEIKFPGGDIHVVDQEEYERHKWMYRYTPFVEKKIMNGLHTLLSKIKKGKPPFHDDWVYHYYDLYKQSQNDQAENQQAGKDES